MLNLDSPLNSLVLLKIIKREDAPRLETVKVRRGEILMSGEKCMMVNTIESGVPTPQPPPRADRLPHRGDRHPLHRRGDPRDEAQDAFLVSPNASHNFDATGDKPAVPVEAFAPPREDYLERVAQR